MQCGVYKITNSKGSIYVGSSININQRLKRYATVSYSRSQRKLHNSIKKYGWDSHKVEIICLCEPDKRYEIERAHGDALGVLSRDNLNLALPRKGALPGKCSKETKKKMSDSGKKRAMGEKEKRAEIAKRTFTGVKQSSEHIEKRKMFGEKNPMYGVRGRQHHNYGKDLLTREQRERIKQILLIKTKRGLNPRARVVVNTCTKEEYACAKDAADAIGMKYTTLIAKLRGVNKNNTNLRYKHNDAKNTKQRK